MANIQLNWTVPAIGGLTNIDKIIVLRGDRTAGTPATCEIMRTRAATDPALDSSDANTKCVVTDATRELESFLDEGVPNGTWQYGVFAVNSAGANACLADTASISAEVVIST